MTQLDLFYTEDNIYEPVKLRNGEYLYIREFFKKEQADFYMETFMKNIQWQQEEMKMYGRVVKFPRLTAWYGDNNKPYSFSGITLQPKDWTSELLSIKKQIELLSDVTFNSVLLNKYRDGNDSIAWHTDAEKELGHNPVIVSVNFGAERIFQLKHIQTNERLDITLSHGSILIMMGELQHYWQHQVPKTKKTKDPRINLTFRKII